MKFLNLMPTNFFKSGAIVLALSSQSKGLDVVFLGPLSVVATVAAPVVTAYASPQTAAVYNACNLISPLVNIQASYTMDNHRGGFLSGPGLIFAFSTFRNVAELGMGVGAAYSSWSYLSGGDAWYSTVALTLTSVNAVLTSVGTCLMYGINFSDWYKRK